MINQCTFIGRLGQDPKAGTFKNSSGDGNWSSFSLAIDKGGPKKEDSKPLWINVTCFGKSAVAVSTYLKKGALVYVAGEIDLEEYTPKDQPGAAPKQSLKLVAHVVKFLERKADGATGQTAAAPGTKTATAGVDEDIPF